MSKYFSCILFLLIGFISWTQNNSKIYGKVTDESGEVLTGASVIYRTDVSFGSISDFDGKFELIVPAGKCKLICRYTGMKTDTLTFNLQPQEQRRGSRALRPVESRPTAHGARACWRTWRGCLRGQRGARYTPRRWPRLFFTDTAPGRRLRLRNAVAEAF